MRNRSKLSGLTRSTMFLLLAAVTLLPLSGCGPHSGLSSLRAGQDAEKSPDGKYWDIKADEWYTFALGSAQEVLALAEKGKAEAKMVAEAQYVLGKLYFGGKGVPQNTTEATKWFQKAADQGNKEAVALLAEITEKQKAEEAKKIVEQQAAEARKMREQREAEANKIQEQQEAQEAKKQKLKKQQEAETRTVVEQKGLAEMQTFHKEHYDPNDVVAQVLNYSDFGEDVRKEKDTPFWYAKSKCVYAKAGERFENLLSMLKKFSGELQVIDLNKIDPRTVKVGICFPVEFRGMKPYTCVKVGNVEFVGPVLFSPPLDKGRLERGWSLIFSKHCTGTQKAF